MKRKKTLEELAKNLALKALRTKRGDFGADDSSRKAYYPFGFKNNRDVITPAMEKNRIVKL